MAMGHLASNYSGFSAEDEGRRPLNRGPSEGGALKGRCQWVWSGAL